MKRNLLDSLDERLARAIVHFWKTRDSQRRKQGRQTGQRDQGARSAVTGGAQLDGFVDLIVKLLRECGLRRASIIKKPTTLPGYFRPTKDWDLVVLYEENLVATIEFKSQVGSFGNNYNNRVEEALGNATDLWTAYREGAFAPSMRPWLGYLMLLEEAPGSTRVVRVAEPHFPVFPEFKGASYVGRYELFCERLVRERLYDSSCLLLSSREAGRRGYYREPSVELGFRNFVVSLLSKLEAHRKFSGR